MRIVDGALRASASDLMRFKGCAHATTLDLRHLEVRDLTPDADDESAVLLQRKGDEHELAFLAKLRARGLTILDIPKEGLPLERSVALTHDALSQGPDVIFQGALLGGIWGGYTDFLERIETPSALGPFSYEVVDTKLKRSPDPKHVLQLALYSDLLAEAQGVAPSAAHLELGSGERFSVRLADVSAYARQARRTFARFLEDRPATRPEPVSACGLCRWQSHCRSEWERGDDLALVANMTRGQRSKARDAGATTLTALASLEQRIPKLSAETQRRLQTQARLQRDRRAGGAPAFELRDLEPGKGLALMPEPDEGDVFYDIEGDPYHEGGLEYLHGLWMREGGRWAFTAIWAHDRDAEGVATAELVTMLTERMRSFPRAHVYHYANYEVAALRHLTGAHRVAEAAMDQLQRERRFVDLFRVVSGGLVASEGGYSIKDLEAFYMGKRDEGVATAGASVVAYERWRETREQAILDEIEAYNRTDCVSTQLLRDWLVRDVRPSGMAWRQRGPVPETTGPVDCDDGRIGILARLKPAAPRLGDEEIELLADLASFHAREDKPGWWAIFDRLAQESDELLDDLDCIQGLEADGPPVKVTAKSFERTYRFPAQETKLRAGKAPCVKPADMPEDVSLRELDHEGCRLVLRRSSAKGPLPDRLDLLPPKPLQNSVLRDAIGATIDNVASGAGGSQAIEDLLRRGPPRLRGVADGVPVVDADADLSAEVARAVAAMNCTVLPIQGPPGSGKTYVSAVAIVELVRSGRRVGVSSNSHKAITNLLAEVVRRASIERVRCSVVHKGDSDNDGDATGITSVRDNDCPEIGMADVVGATAWHFARYASPAFSHLFVDEAGQVSLANVVAMSRSANNLVLVGDPMQLPQPLQGTHPGRSGESCLEYLLDGARVVAPDRGIFIPVTRRMHPNVCSFISDAVYEGRLTSHPDTAARRIVASDGGEHAGARMSPVVHFGRSQVASEEVDALRAFVETLPALTYHDGPGSVHPAGHADVLVVAPYNAQVNALRAALPAGVRVGTVDRFQGQEAPICLVSMTTSSGEEMPRDIEFLFSLNRLNVAVSRAKVLAIVFASPALLDTPCRTIREMTLVNTLCLLAERGAVDLAGD